MPSALGALRVLAVAHGSLAATSPAQSTVPQTQVFLGASVARLRTSHPEGAPVGLGGTFGAARYIGDRISLRAALGVVRVIMLSDHIGLCLYPKPDGSCLPRAVFPRWLTTAELQSAFAPVRQVPLSLIVGAGLTRSDGAGESYRQAPVASTSTHRALWRAGLELSLGRTRQAPRIQFSRTGFSSSIHSITFVDGLMLSFWPIF